MKTKLLALFLLAGSTAMFAGSHFSIGIGVGAPYGGYYVAAPPPPPVYYAPPPVSYVRPGYTWVGGYWYPVGPRYYWRGGYWARRPYPSAVWVGPRYYGSRWYGGYWRR